MMRPIVGAEAPNDSETVGIETLVLSQLLNIFPNPTDGTVNINLFEGNYNDYQIRIFNTLGQQLTQQDLTPRMDLTSQIPGIYFLQFIHKETLAAGNYKIILEK